MGIGRAFSGDAMTARRLRPLAALLAATLVAGCVTTDTRPDYMKRISGYPKTVSQSFSTDPRADFNRIATFAMVAPDPDLPDNQLAGLIGQGVRRIVAEYLVNFGYREAPAGETPDMIVAVSGHVGTTSHVVAGGTGYLPIWEPAPTYNLSGTQFTGGQMTSFSGTATPIGGGTTSYVPYQQPDKVVTQNRARVTIASYDPATRRKLAIAQALGETDSSHSVYATQFLIPAAMQQFPKNEGVRKPVIERLESGPSIGLRVWPITINGNDIDYYVTSVEDGSPAAAAGVQPYDILVSLGGDRLRNISWSASRAEKPFRLGEPIPVRLLREGKEFDVVIQPRPRPAATPPRPAG